MPKDASEPNFSEVLDPALHYPYFDWTEDEGNMAIRVKRNCAPELQAFHSRIASHVETTAFSVNEQGLHQISDLITTLQQMQTYILDRIAPMEEIVYNNGIDRSKNQ